MRKRGRRSRTRIPCNNNDDDDNYSNNDNNRGGYKYESEPNISLRKSHKLMMSWWW